MRPFKLKILFTEVGHRKRFSSWSESRIGLGPCGMRERKERQRPWLHTGGCTLISLEFSLLGWKKKGQPIP